MDPKEQIVMVKLGCGYCGVPAETKCARCKSVRYCGKGCQKNDWKRHKGTCDPKNNPEPDVNVVEVIDTTSMDLAVEVRPSKIHGRGVFSTKFIKKGSLVCFYDGSLKNSQVKVKMRKSNEGILSIVSADDYFRSSTVPDPDYDRIMAHPNPKMNGYVVVGSTEDHPSGFGVGQFVNDGAKPRMSSGETDFADASRALQDYQEKSLAATNCEVNKNFWFVTTKDVEENQELLTHYGFEFWVHKLMLAATNPNSRFLFYSLHDQSTKPFNLRQFFDYDKTTLKSFMISFLGMDEGDVNNYESPKDLLFKLMEEVNIMNPAAFG